MVEYVLGKNMTVGSIPPRSLIEQENRPMEPMRLLIAIEVAPDEAQDLLDGLNQFFKIKAPNVRYNVRRVELKDGPETETASEKVAGK